MRTARNLRRIGTSHTKLGEGIRYDAESDTLFWHDIPESRGFRQHGSEPETEIPLGPEAAFSCLMQDGRFLSGGCKGFYIDGLSVGENVLSDADVLNDGAVHPSGEFLVFGSRDKHEEEPRGHMWVLGRELHRLPWTFTVFNGPAFSPDGEIIYFADSPKRTIYAARVDHETQSIGDRETFAVVPADLGYPDGMTCDDQGGLWSAHWDGGCVTRYLPDGTVDFRIELPCARATSLAFRGNTLFVTSAKNEIHTSPDDADGGLFAFDTEHSGPPSPRLTPSVIDQIS